MLLHNNLMCNLSICTTRPPACSTRDSVHEESQSTSRYFCANAMLLNLNPRVEAMPVFVHIQPVLIKIYRTFIFKSFFFFNTYIVSLQTTQYLVGQKHKIKEMMWRVRGRAFILLPAQIEVTFPLFSGICAALCLQPVHFISLF